MQSEFLEGAAALGVAQSAFTEGLSLQDKAESCRLARPGPGRLPVARAGLDAGQEAVAEATKQSLEYLVQLDAYAEQAMASFCK